jgi:hypothetical protein
MIEIRPEMDEETATRFRSKMALIAARSRGRVTVDKILADHQAGLLSVYAVMDGAEVSSFVATRTIQYPSGLKVYRIDYGAGCLEDAYEFIGELEEKARRAGADRIRIEGRAGWKTIFPDWEHVSTIIEKGVTT